MTRVAVFIDYQNAYRGARSAFNLDSADFVEGQISSSRLGLHVVHVGRGVDPERQLVSVTVYRGEPSSRFSPKGLAACQR
jgi:hypothetical protein